MHDVYTSDDLDHLHIYTGHEAPRVWVLALRGGEFGFWVYVLEPVGTQRDHLDLHIYTGFLLDYSHA